MKLRSAVLVVPLTVLLLAGCVPGGPDALPTVDPNLPIPSLTPNPTPTITPTAGPMTKVVPLACSDLLTLQALYDYNPNVSLLPSFSPSDASPAGQAIAQQGIACEVINQTSGVTFDFGVVLYTDSGYSAKLAAVSAAATPATSFDGYFDVAEGGGLAQLFVAPYYLTVQAADATAEGDLSELVAIATTGLG